MSRIKFHAKQEAQTQELGRDIAVIIKPGDMLALSGDLGAGKSVLARAIIQALADDWDLDVASPSYTLCNQYNTIPPVSHFDLYRLGDPEELEELGLLDALEIGCVIIEWPEMGFQEIPSDAVHVKIEIINPEQRQFTLSGNAEFLQRIERSIAIRTFLNTHGLERASRRPFPADASARRYETVTDPDGKRWYFMDAPKLPDGPVIQDGKPYSKIAHLAESVTPFVAIGHILRQHGFAAPDIPAFDLEKGFVLIEDLGNGAIVDEKNLPIPKRYLAAIAFLSSLHGDAFDPGYVFNDETRYVIPSYDREAMLIELQLLIDWYVPYTTGQAVSDEKRTLFRELWAELIHILETQEKTLVLRDFHSPNIIWRPSEAGNDRIGVIDFQDAVIGPVSYDVASLAQDARTDVSKTLEEELIQHYEALRRSQDREFDAEQFRICYAIMAAQRATKILGIFVRLNVRDNKPVYLGHLPRIQGYLKRSLSHPVLTPYREWLQTVIEL